MANFVRIQPDPDSDPDSDPEWIRNNGLHIARFKRMGQFTLY